MADENVARFEQMEQATQEPKEMLTEIILRMTKGKVTTKGPSLTEVATRSRIVQEEPLYPPIFHQFIYKHLKRCVLYQILFHLLLKQLKGHVQYFHHL